MQKSRPIFAFFEIFTQSAPITEGKKSEKSVEKWFFVQIAPIMVAVFQGLKKNIYTL